MSEQKELKTEDGKDIDSLRQVTWGIYWLSCAPIVLSFIPPLVTLAFILSLIALIMALVKRNSANNTIYRSHLDNIVLVEVVGWVVNIIGFFAIGLSFVNGNLNSSILTGGGIMVFSIAILVWAIYRLVKGMMRMNENRPFV